jgi:hypothetical protein
VPFGRDPVDGWRTPLPSPNLPRAARLVPLLALLATGCSAAGKTRHERVAGGRLTCELRHPRYHTLPALRPTGYCFARRPGTSPAAEDILVTPRPDPNANHGAQFGLMLFSPGGRLLFYQRRPSKVHDFKVVTYRGQRDLAYFQQDGDHGYYQLLDSHYRPVVRIRAGHGYHTNLHELEVTPQGTAYVSADVPHGSIKEYVVQEVDIATGRVLFEWHSLRHVPPRDTYERRPAHGVWDYVHGNAIDPPRSPRQVVLVSLRNTSSVYGVDRRTGSVRWIFGGKRDQFGLRRHPGWVFCSQHDAHRLPDGDLELFDNGGSYMHGEPHCPVHPARALVFHLDPAHHTARLVRQIDSRPMSKDGRGFFSGWVGSARPMSGGRTLIDWGQIPRVSEVGPDGMEDALLRLEFWSYRAFPAAWTGDPPGRPLVAARRRGDNVDVWASWNGATRIARWEVLAGADAQQLAPVASVAFADLETHVVARTQAPLVAVRALDATGAVLGESRVLRVG